MTAQQAAANRSKQGWQRCLLAFRARRQLYHAMFPATVLRNRPAPEQPSTHTWRRRRVGCNSGRHPRIGCTARRRRCSVSAVSPRKGWRRVGLLRRRDCAVASLRLLRAIQQLVCVVAGPDASWGCAMPVERGRPRAAGAHGWQGCCPLRRLLLQKGKSRDPARWLQQGRMHVDRWLEQCCGTSCSGRRRRRLAGGAEARLHKSELCWLCIGACYNCCATYEFLPWTAPELGAQEKPASWHCRLLPWLLRRVVAVG